MQIHCVSVSRRDIACELNRLSTTGPDTEGFDDDVADQPCLGFKSSLKGLKKKLQHEETIDSLQSWSRDFVH